MSEIASVLGVNVNLIRSDRKHPQYRVRTSTITSNTALLKYLAIYPLRGTKFMDFND